MAEDRVTLKDFSEIKQQIGELHGSLYKNGFRQDIVELKQLSAQNAELIREQHTYLQKLNHRIDLFEANREHTCPVAERLVIQQQKQKESSREFWQDMLTKTRFWLVVVGFLGAANLGDIIRAIKNVIN